MLHHDRVMFVNRAHAGKVNDRGAGSHMTSSLAVVRRGQYQTGDNVSQPGRERAFDKLV